MESGMIILRQLLIMGIYCCIGYVLHRAKLVSQEGCRAFSRLLLYVILPCVIIQSFMREADAQTTAALAISFGASIVLLLLAMGVSRLLHRQPVEEFAASFSNAGFMEIPLISMALGSSAVLYIAPFTALLNILQWTYG